MGRSSKRGVVMKSTLGAGFQHFAKQAEATVSHYDDDGGMPVLTWRLLLSESDASVGWLVSSNIELVECDR